MSDAALHALADAAGILVRWHDYRGHEHTVAPDTLRAVLAALDLSCATPAQAVGSLEALRREAPAPEPAPIRRAPAVRELAQRERPWGLSAQLYSLRRPGDGGLADFTALADCARAVGTAGADALAISPVHAPFAAEPERYSPYMPSNRLMLNALHVDPEQAERALAAPLARAPEDLRALEALPLADWPAATRARLSRLRALFARVAPRLDSDPAFRWFRQEGRPALEQHACFEALQAWHLERGAGRDWRRWPVALHDPLGPAVAEFAREHADAVTFHVFLQWLADGALRAAHADARASGMAIGLIADLAVGVDPAGSEAWSRPDTLLRGLQLGAPPDLLNAQGQNWGLTTFAPRALARQAGAPLLELFCTALRYAGGVRIDHVLGLNRLWVIPDGAGPTAGAYLRNPLALLLDELAAEARRQRALIIGEDLGTVPAGLDERLAAAGVLGLRVLWFMRDHGLFIDPARWPTQAVATTATHDLPTVAGWWRARDLHWRARAGQLDAVAALQEHAARARDRRVLWDAFLHAGVAAGSVPEEDPRRAVDAAIGFVARTPAPLTLIPLEDIAGLDEQPNLPGTTDEHPNWRRRLPAPAPALLAWPEAAARLRLLRETRAAQAQTA